MLLPDEDQNELEQFLDLLVDSFEDDEAFARESLSIMIKSGAVIPFEWNPAQRRLNRAIELQREAGQPIRIVVLKARQVGFSTSVAGKFFKETVFTPGQSTLIVAQELDAAQNLFSYYYRFHQHYRPYKGLLSLPKLISDTDEALVDANDSKIKIATANNLKGMRSNMLRRLHLSEYAFYRDAHTFMGAVLQCVPDDPGTMIIIESTANGLGGPFYEKWTEATDPKITSDWLGVFYAWHEEPTYTIDLLGDEKKRFQDSLTKEERDLMTRYKLRLSQLAWRRYAIRSKCEGDDRLFRQEYPSCPEEAFLVTGRPRFNPVFFQWMPTQKPAEGGLRQFDVGMKSITQFIPCERGELHLWKKPERGREYIIGIDSATGIDVKEGHGKADPDYSVGQVFERSVGEQVAMLRERLEAIPFAHYIYELGKWYNWAYLVLEINTGGDGIGVMRELVRLGYPIDRFYHREHIDERSEKKTTKIGWLTTPATKPQLVATLESMLQARALILHCAITVKECYSFVRKPNGRAEATDGCHDDTVIALALAALGIIVAPQLNIKSTGRTPAAVRQYGQTHRERIKHEQQEGNSSRGEVEKLRLMRRNQY